MKLNLLRKIGLNLIVVVCIVQYMLSLPLYAYHIREAHERDIPELTDCHYESWHSTYDHIFNYAYCLKNSRQRLEQYWNKFFKKKDGRFVLVVQEHGEIIGLISAGPFKSIKEENFMIPPNLISAEIYKFYIRQKDQNRGIGKSLLQSCCKRLIRQHYSEVSVRVFSGNENATMFYKNQGFYFRRFFNYAPLTPYDMYTLRLQ